MGKTYYNRVQIIKKIASAVDKTQAETDKIVVELENQIIELGLERGRVMISGFGSFNIYKRKSTTIKQIRTKKKRLVISQKVIKFITHERFKKVIRGGKTGYSSTEKPISHAKTGKIQTQPQPQPIKPHSFPLKKFSYFGRVSKERFKQLLGRRASSQKNEGKREKVYLDDSVEGKLFLSILKLAKEQGQDKVNFIFDNGLTYIYCGKPRKLIGKLSNDVCRNFFRNRLDLDDFEIPQERIALLEFKHQNRGIIILNIHSLPTHTGASVKVDFKFK